MNKKITYVESLKLSKADKRRLSFMPGGVPSWIRCYDNGGTCAKAFCAQCYEFYDEIPDDGLCSNMRCPYAYGKQSKLIKTPTGSADRYTVILSGRYKGRPVGRCEYLVMSGAPFHPLGIGMWDEAAGVIDAPKGFTPKLGSKSPFGARRIPFRKLPEDCRKLVIRHYEELWQLKEP